jgi:hypothetical protein
LSAEKCHEHLAPLPGTDGALALGLMHVIIGEGLYDADYVEKYTLGFDALKVRVGEFPPQKVAEITGLPAERIVALAREYAATRPAAIRLNYGLQRHSGGGMAVRNILCLPALTGDWRHPRAGCSPPRFFGMNDAKMERPISSSSRESQSAHHLRWRSALLQRNRRSARSTSTTRIRGGRARLVKVVKGFSREDLFTVVHEQFFTDTCDYADIVLPATTQLEHYDVHTAYGHLYVMANSPAIAPLGESLPNSEVFRRLAVRLGFAEACFRDSDEDICRQALESSKPAMRGIEWESLKRAGFQRLNLPERFAPFAQGGFATPSGKCEFYSETAKAMGMDPLPGYVPPRESARSNPALARKYPLAMISPPNRHFLNSSFANMPFAIAEAREPSLDIHPKDAAARGIASGDTVRVFNDRGSLRVRARVGDRAREGVVVALGVVEKAHRRRLQREQVTSQAVTDIGRGATFYDCLVEVRGVARLPRAARGRIDEGFQNQARRRRRACRRGCAERLLPGRQARRAEGRRGRARDQRARTTLRERRADAGLAPRRAPVFRDLASGEETLRFDRARLWGASPLAGSLRAGRRRGGTAQGSLRPSRTARGPQGLSQGGGQLLRLPRGRPQEPHRARGLSP